MAVRRSLVRFCTVLAVLCASPALAQTLGQTPPPPPGQGHGHPPPPQAYEDCRGKRAGETVQHTTPNGKVPATCENSPEGLVARPHQPPPPAPPPPGSPPGSLPGPPPAPPGGTANPRS